MKNLITILFIIEFILLLRFFIKTLFNKGFTFKLGLTYGVLYFVFIPISVLLITGKVELVKSDFGQTKLTDIYLNNDIKGSFVLIAYLFSLIIYLYFFKRNNTKDNLSFKPNIKFYLFVYFASLIIILIGSGLLQGGSWYSARHSFMVRNGTLAILITFIINSSKILIISSIILLWSKEKINNRFFLLFIMSFTIFDMVFTGNRIYLFSAFSIIGLLFLKKYPYKIILSLPFIIPIIFYVGYFAAIFRHMRGLLFQNGLPTIEVFKKALAHAMRIDPPNPTSFFLNISESVNFNVVYNIINNYDKTLYGATYLKTLVYFIPRSIWVNKPESITKITANYFGSVSLVTTVFGEMQMNFSYLGIFLLPLILYLAESILDYFKFNNQIFNFIFFIMGILIFRMPFSDEILVYIFLISIIYLSNKKFVIRL